MGYLTFVSRILLFSCLIDIEYFSVTSAYLAFFLGWCAFGSQVCSCQGA